MMDVALEPTESFIVRIDEVSLGSEVSLASPGVPPESIAHEIFIEDSDDVVSVGDIGFPGCHQRRGNEHDHLDKRQGDG